MKKALVSILVCFTLMQFAAAQADTTTLTKVGDKAPGFSCTTIDGKTIDISKLQGKIIMINFQSMGYTPEEFKKIEVLLATNLQP
jgi:hypothetical protein